jgi:hypothetical protein
MFDVAGPDFCRSSSAFLTVPILTHMSVDRAAAGGLVVIA